MLLLCLWAQAALEGESADLAAVAEELGERAEELREALAQGAASTMDVVKVRRGGWGGRGRALLLAAGCSGFAPAAVLPRGSAPGAV